MRLIDSDADVCFYVETWKCNCSGYGVQNVMAVDDISVLPEIPVESLPVVQQLRANLELSDQEMQNLLESMESLYKQRDELRAELERVKKERDAAVEMLHSLANEVGTCTGCKRLNKECSEVYICECDGEDHWEWCEVKED